MLPLPPECDHVLVSADAIRQRVAELGAELACDFAAEKDVRFVTVLKGGLFFLADKNAVADVRQCGHWPLSEPSSAATTKPPPSRCGTAADAIPKRARSARKSF